MKVSAKRGFAWLIDWYVAGVLAWVPIMLIGSNLYGRSVGSFLSEFDGNMWILMGLLGILVVFFYVVLVPMFIWRGQTLGKKLIRLIVVEDNLKEVTNKSLLIRGGILLFFDALLTGSFIFIGQMIELSSLKDFAMIYSYGVVALTILSAGMAMIRKDGKSLHDIVVHTKVIEKKGEN